MKSLFTRFTVLLMMLSVAGVAVAASEFNQSPYCKYLLANGGNPVANPDTRAYFTWESMVNGQGKVDGIVLSLKAFEPTGKAYFRSDYETKNIKLNDEVVQWDSIYMNGTIAANNVDTIKLFFEQAQDLGTVLTLNKVQWGTDLKNNCYRQTAFSYTLGSACCPDTAKPVMGTVLTAVDATSIKLQPMARDTNNCGIAAEVPACMIQVDGGAWTRYTLSTDGAVVISGLQAQTTYNISMYVLDLEDNASDQMDLTLTTDAATSMSQYCNSLLTSRNNTGSKIALSSTTLFSRDDPNAVVGVLYQLHPMDNEPGTVFRNDGIRPDFAIDGKKLSTADYTIVSNGTQAILGFNKLYAAASVFTWSSVQWNSPLDNNASFSTSYSIELGTVCNPSNDVVAPSMLNLSQLRAGLHKIDLNVSSSDNEGVVAYFITAQFPDTAMVWTIANDPAVSQKEISLDLPANVQIPTEQGPALQFVVYAVDAAGNYSTPLTQTAVVDTQAPTCSLECGYATTLGITFRVSAAADAACKVVSYNVRATSTSGPLNFQGLTANNGALLVNGLSAGTAYEFEVWAVDNYGNVQFEPTRVVCNTEDTNPFCGALFSRANRPMYDYNSYYSRIFYSMSQTATNEITVLLAPHPYGQPISGVDFELVGKDTNPAGTGNTYIRVRPKTSNKTYDYPDLATLTNKFTNNSTAKAEWVDVAYSEEPTLTFRALKLSFKYAGSVEGFNLKWYQEDEEYTVENNEHMESTLFSPLNFNPNQLVCSALGSQPYVLDADWQYGNPTHLSAAQNLQNNPIPTYNYVDGPLLSECTNLLWATTFSPAAGVDTTHLDLNGIEVIDNSGVVELAPGRRYREGYSAGNFMQPERSYTIVSDPSSLQASLAEKTDKLNRLVFNVGDAPYGKGDTLLAIYMEHLHPGSDVVMEFDYEELSPECSDQHLQERLLGVSISGNNTDGVVDSMYVSYTDRTGAWVSDKRTSGNAPLYNGGQGKVTMVTKANGIKDVAFIKMARSLDCVAVGISNLRLYGCLDPYITSDYDDKVPCEGTEIELTAYALPATSDNEITWSRSEGDSLHFVSMNTTGRSITVEATTQRVYYRAEYNDIFTDPYQVQGIVCCLDRDTLWNEDFGTVGEWKRLSSPYVRGHVFQDLIWTKDMAGNDSLDAAKSRIDDGDYAVISNTTYANQYVPWKPDRTDHTGNPNGGFVLINVGHSGKILVLQMDVDGPFCENVWYNFSMWASQISNYGNHPSSFILEIWEVDANGIETNMAGQFETGLMDAFEMDVWRNYQLSVTTKANVPTLRIKVYNMGLTGDGNDLAIDDLNFSRCTPVVRLYADYPNLAIDKEVECGQQNTLNAVFEGVVESYFQGTPYYTWQQSADQGATWTIVADTVLGMDTLSIQAQNPEGMLYRAVVSAAPEVGHAVATGQPVKDCDVYVITNNATVTCTGGCFDPEISSFESSVELLCANQYPTQVDYQVKVVDKPSYVSPKTGITTVYGVTSYEYFVHYPGQSYTPQATHTVSTLEDALTYAPSDSVWVTVKVNNTDACHTQQELMMPVVKNPAAPRDSTYMMCQQLGTYDMGTHVPALKGFEVLWYTSNDQLIDSVPQLDTNLSGTFGFKALYKPVGSSLCSSPMSVQALVVKERPEASITGNATLDCRRLSDTLQIVTNIDAPLCQWSTTENTPSIITANAGNYWAVVTNQRNGCASDTARVEVLSNTNPVTLSLQFTPDQRSLDCRYNTITVKAVASAAKAGDYTFTLMSTDQRQFVVQGDTHPLVEAGDYRFHVIDAISQCEAEQNFSITEDLEKPSFQLMASVTELTCKQPESQLTTNLDTPSNYDFMWSNGQTTPSITVTTPGMYGVVVTLKRNGCSDEINDLEITEFKDTLRGQLMIPVSQINIGNTVQPTLRLDSGTPSSIQWQRNGNAMGVADLSFEDKPYTNTNYRVIATGDCNTLDQNLDVTVDWPTLFMPYATTGATAPNQSFVQDMGNGSTQGNFAIEVFNRSGTLVFKGDNGWDGTSCGKLVLPGVYFYVVTLPDGTVRKGTIEVYK